MFDSNDIAKHKVFLSFHHQDNEYRKRFEKDFSTEFESSFLNLSVQDGDIDPNNKTDTIRQIIREKYISDTSVTIVLIGSETWKRKHVDWEIGYSLTKTSKNTRSGLIGILLPTYKKCLEKCDNCCIKKTENGIEYTPCNIPPRLYDNIERGYAKIYSYPKTSDNLRQWIHEAFQRRNNGLQCNTRPYFVNNRSDSYWR